MTAIFISHASDDNAAAAQMKAWLQGQGHISLFLDFDPDLGIKGGSAWEQTLYKQLRQCQAVIALLTPSWLMSKWCFAELVQARERGKAIFPVKMQPCEAGCVFGDLQHIDLTSQPEEGFRRLVLGLLESGLDPANVFDWDPRRPPYPGLLAFEEEDAAIFFGRGEEILKARESLEGLRRQGQDAVRFALLLGASGSGKSSLMRAGVIPRLKKNPSAWFALPPFRPQVEPLDELAVTFATAITLQGRPRDSGAIRTELHAAASKRPADGQPLLRLARELAVASGRPETTVLITIDQAEELFGYSSSEGADDFLRLVRATLDLADQRIMVVATLRSDCLAEFQSHAALRDGESHSFRYKAIPVDPMPLRNFSQIIQGPASLAGLRIDDGLAEAMVNDTAGRDALPLLAFTLRRLYERYGDDGRLSIDRYDSLGRLEGSVREAAQRVITEANPTPDHLEALHAAFVPMMVRINAEGGFARRRAVIEDLPCRALPLLRRFVDARLLVTDRDPQGKETIEVAHEALLRTWPQLGAWLAEDRDKLRLLAGIQRCAEEWEAGGGRDDLLNHRNDRLKDAEALIANPRFAFAETALEHAYLDACRTAQQALEAAEKEEQERRIRDAERIVEEEKKAAAAQKRTARVALIGLAAALMVAGLAIWQYHRAVKETEVATARQLAAQAMLDLDVQPPRNLLLALESISIAEQVGAFSPLASRQLLNDVLGSTGGIPLRHSSQVNAVAFSPDDRWVATGSDGVVQLWNTQAPATASVRLGQHGKVNALAFTPDGRTLATAGDEGTVTLWDMNATDRAANGRVLTDHHEHPISDIAVSRGGRWLATASEDHTARLWDLTAASPASTSLILRHDDSVRTLAFSPDNRLLATGGGDGKIRLWNLLDPDPSATPAILDIKADVRKVAFSPDGKWLVAGSTENHQVVLLYVAASDERFILSVEQWVNAVAFSPDGRWLATPSQYDVRLWDLTKPDPSNEPLVLPGHKNAIEDLSFSPDGKILATASADHTIHLWSVSDHFNAPGILRGHEGAVLRLAFSHDGRLIATASTDRTARLWRTASPFAEPLALRAPGDATGLHMWKIRAMNLPATPRSLGEGFDPNAGSVFSPDGRWVATISSGDDGSPIQLWSLAGPSPTRFRIHHGGRVWAAPVFSPDGRWLATAGVEDPAVKLWDLKSSDPSSAPRVLRGHRGPVRSLAFSADGRYLVSGARDGYALVWDLHGDAAIQPRRLAGGDVKAVAISGDGRRVVTGNWEPDNAALIWDLSSAVSSTNPVTLAFADRVYDVAFSPNGRWVAAGSWDHTTQLMDLTKPGAKPYVLRGHTARTLSVAFSPDSQWLATGNEDRSARLWNLAQADPSAEATVLQGAEKVGNVSFSFDGRLLALNQTEYRSSPFSPDGQSFVSSNPDTRLYHVSLDDVRQIACQTAGRNLTQGEWGPSFGDQRYRKTCPQFQ